MSPATEPRRELVFDGKGINGPDQYRERVATFTSEEAAKKYGPLFEAVPELLAALKQADDTLSWAQHFLSHANREAIPDTLEIIRAAIASASPRK